MAQAPTTTTDMKETYSPGPWEVHVGGTSVVDTKGKLIASCGFMPYISHHQEECNARLISAAPEMVRLLDDILDDISGAEPEIYERIRKVLLKAVGGTK